MAHTRNTRSLATVMTAARNSYTPIILLGSSGSLKYKTSDIEDRPFDIGSWTVYKGTLREVPNVYKLPL